MTATETTIPKRRGRKSLPINPDDLPNRARILREAKGWSLMETARRANVNKNGLFQFEREGIGIRHDKRFILAEVLGVGLGELLTPGKNFARQVRHSLNSR